VVEVEAEGYSGATVARYSGFKTEISRLASRRLKLRAIRGSGANILLRKELYISVLELIGRFNEGRRFL